MVSDAKTNLNEFYKSLLVKEKHLRRRTYLFTLIPILIGLIWLLWTALEVRRLENRDEVLKKEIIEKESKIEALEKQLYEMNYFLDQGIELSMTDIKYAVSDNVDLARMLEMVFHLKHQKIPFRLGGRDPETGFDSPSMMNYILHSYDFVPSNNLSRLELKNYLQKVTTPKTGDIFFYEAGFVMFYIRKSGQEYCMGMTPFGIMYLDKNFAEIREIRRINYSKKYSDE
jgi:hypothetical protein